MTTYFVLYLLCVSCQPHKAFILHDIPAFMGGSTQWANENCKRYGDILSGDWQRRNVKPPRVVRKDIIVYTCVKESAEF